jgi:putative transposase
MPDRAAFFAIFYILRTGVQWKALPRGLGAGSTVHDRFQKWRKAGVFNQLWTLGLLEFEIKVGLDLAWQALDGAMTKAPLGGPGTGPNPTDRGKSGTKRHLLTEGNGLPIGLTVTGATTKPRSRRCWKVSPCGWKARKSPIFVPIKAMIMPIFAR